MSKWRDLSDGVKAAIAGGIVAGIFGIIAACIPVWGQIIHLKHTDTAISYSLLGALDMDVPTQDAVNRLFFGPSQRANIRYPLGWQLMAVYNGNCVTRLKANSIFLFNPAGMKFVVNKSNNTLHFECELDATPPSPGTPYSEKHDLVIDTVLTNQLKTIRFSNTALPASFSLYFETLKTDINAPMFVIGCTSTSFAVNDGILTCN